MTGLVLVLLCAFGCAEPAPPSAPSSTPTTGAPLYSAEVGYCAEQTNRYRSSVGRAALGRSAALEEYAAAAARTDGLAHVAHQHARTTNSGNGLSRAENAILWWSLRHYRSVQQVIKDGLAEMWGQGTSGQHYQNLVGAYSEVGCGVFVNGDEVTVVQAFR